MMSASSCPARTLAQLWRPYVGCCCVQAARHAWSSRPSLPLPSASVHQLGPRRPKHHTGSGHWMPSVRGLGLYVLAGARMCHVPVGFLANMPVLFSVTCSCPCNLSPAEEPCSNTHLACGFLRAANKSGKQLVIAQIAPAVRVAIAETMGLNPGGVTVGQLVTGLRQIGFDYVFGEYLHGARCAFGSPSWWQLYSCSWPSPLLQLAFTPHSKLAVQPQQA